MKSPSPKFWFLLLLAGLTLVSCRSEGHRHVDEMAATLEAGARLIATGETPEDGAKAALEYFQANAVQMRIIQSRFDDTIRTVNRYQREELRDYARERLAGVQAVIDTWPARSR